MTVVAITLAILVLALVAWQVLLSTQGPAEKRRTGIADERTAPRPADHRDGAGAKHRADRHHRPERVAATGERDQGAAGRRGEFRANRHARTNGDRHGTEKHPRTDGPDSKTTRRVSGVKPQRFLRHEIAGRHPRRSQEPRLAGRSNARTPAGRLPAAFAIRVAVSLFVGRYSRRGDFSARQEDDVHRFQISSRRFPAHRHRWRRSAPRFYCRR